MSFEKHGSRHRLARTFRVAPEVTSDVVLAYLQSLDCPRALTAYLLYVNKEHEQLAQLTCNPLEYSNAFEFRDAYAATKFLSKFKSLSLNYDLDEVALLKFKKFESQCKLTNSRFRSLMHDPLYKGRVVWLHHAVKQKIERILGDYSVEELAGAAAWGPGASTLIKARIASSSNKFQHEVGITRDLYSLFFPSDDFRLFEGLYPLWADHLKKCGSFPTFQVGNKVVTVPKDSTTNRVIAIEPGINLWFQKGIGEMIGNRLLRYGVDLRYQDRNQHLAFLSSKTGINATVDFSSASDSISSELVRELLPPRWFSLLDSCRSHFGTLDGDLLKWEKFSSMGNGFTFQLESLIFYAVSLCCAEYQQIPLSKEGAFVSVYGDDVVIPCRCLDLFSAMIAFYGFTLNTSKTHSSSVFRESCGAHYFAGIDVKPIYLKDKLSTVQTVYRLANAVRRLSHRRNCYSSCDLTLKPTFDYLMSRVPKSLRFKIPETLGDGGFISNWDEATPKRARHGIEGYFVKQLLDASLTCYVDGVGLLLTRLRYPSLQEESNNSPLRGRTRARLSQTLVQQWYDLGPWL